MSNIARFKSQIVSRFSIGGFQIRSDASLVLANQLERTCVTDEARRKLLTAVAAHVQSQNLTIPAVERKHIELALQAVQNAGVDETETLFSVINAFDVPRFRYNEEQRKFERDSSPRTLLPGPSTKYGYMRERYLMLWNKTIRNRMFVVKAITTNVDPNQRHLQLHRIENLLSASTMKNVIVLGLLTQLTEGHWHLEDPTGAVILDLSSCEYSSGLICEGCFVLARGTYADGKLTLSEIAHPPPEEGSSSRAYFGNANTWGGPSKTLLKYSYTLQELEKRPQNQRGIVFLSDCWLDCPTVLAKLDQLIQGFESFPPFAIVLMGPFCKHNENPYALRQCLTDLGEILSKCDQLCANTDLILVPSSRDPCAANILPRPALPAILAQELKERYPRTILASNPCRLQYCTQQIVVCREDLVTKMCRNTIRFPTEGQLEQHFARTLLGQNVLTPMHPIALATHWEYDMALWLYPIPDVVVIGDPCQGFQITENSCTIVNAGSFPKSKYCFKVYYPAERTVEDSQIPDDGQ